MPLAQRRIPWGRNKPKRGWQANPAAVADLGLIFALLASEGAGLAAYDVVSNSKGTLNTVPWTQGLFGPGLSFGAAAADNISGTGINLASSSFSLSWWTSVTAVNYFNFDRTLFGLGSAGGTNTSVNIAFTAAGTVTCSFFGDDHSLAFNNVTFQNSTGWANFILTFNVTTLVVNLYINGVFASTATMGGTFTGNTSWKIGNRADTNSTGTTAFLLDHFIASNTVWQVEQIQRLAGWSGDPFFWMQPQTRRTWFGVTSPPPPTAGQPIFQGGILQSPIIVGLGGGIVS